MGASYSRPHAASVGAALVGAAIVAAAAVSRSHAKVDHTEAEGRTVDSDEGDVDSEVEDKMAAAWKKIATLERELATTRIAKLEAELAQARAEASAAQQQFLETGAVHVASDRPTLNRQNSRRKSRFASIAASMANCGEISPGPLPLSPSPEMDPMSLVQQVEDGRRKLLPSRIIMVRHGQSEGNIDASLYRDKGDNLMELTDTGSAQALEAGKRIKEIIGKEQMIVYVSPFQRTVQTMRNLRTHFEDNIVRTEIEPAVREQEFGNLQDEEFKKYREEQMAIGRFWYRFPTGESGADVYARVDLFWEALLRLNTHPDRAPINNVLIVTHGLTMRLLLMRMNRWSPDTFETVWNPENCGIWILKKDLSLDADLPYVLDDSEGSMPKSTRNLKVYFKGGEEKILTLNDFIKIPQPRTAHADIAKRMLAEQHGLVVSEIIGVDFFVDKKFARYR